MTVWDILEGSQAAERLAEQIASGQPAHAWLLLGPSGSGKKPVALALAAAVNCESKPGVGCGECRSCERILRQRHPDVHHIAPEGPLIPVDVIREAVIPEASRSPFESRFKVFVIEEAHRMNEPAQNALLKTLEEPQPDTIFVLITDQEDEVLETIASRCRIVRLEPVSEARIVELLQGYGVPHELAVLSARLSEGDYSRASSFSRADDVRQRREVWNSLPARIDTPVDALAGADEVIDRARATVQQHEELKKQEVIELAEALGEGRGTAAARNALAKRHKRELRRVEEEVLSEALGTLASFYRDVLAVRHGADEGVTNVDLLEDLGRWAASPASDASLVRAIERCLEAQAGLPKNANVPLAVGSALVEVGRLVGTVSR